MPENSRTWIQQHPVAVYTAGRVALFVAVYVALGLAGARGLLLLALAFLVSGLLSLVVLNGPRSGFSEKVTGLFGRINQRIDDAARAEDDADADAQADVGPVVLAEREADAEPEARQQ